MRSLAEHEAWWTDGHQPAESFSGKRTSMLVRLYQCKELVPRVLRASAMVVGDTTPRKVFGASFLQVFRVV